MFSIKSSQPGSIFLDTLCNLKRNKGNYDAYMRHWGLSGLFSRRLYAEIYKNDTHHYTRFFSWNNKVTSIGLAIVNIRQNISPLMDSLENPDQVSNNLTKSILWDVIVYFTNNNKLVWWILSRIFRVHINGSHYNVQILMSGQDWREKYKYLETQNRPLNIMA